MVDAPANTLSLLADIGGTNTRVALAQGDRLLDGSVKRFRNADYPGLETVLRTYLSSEGNPDCAGACVAVAGPVRDGVASLTNLDWTIDAETVGRAARAETVAVLNDLQAQGYALGHIEAANLRRIVSAPAGKPTASQLVIGVGTGFNCAPVHETPAGRFVPPSEAGHANLPVRTETELSLMKDFETAHGFPAIEDVLSGRGLEHVFSWMSRREGNPREASAAQIMEAVAAGGDPAATRTMKFFAKILGTVCGNLSLIHLPFGGVYLVGGVARSVAPYLESHGFTEAMRDKGRFAGFMKNFSVHVIEDDFAALTGCARHLSVRIPE